MTTVGQRQQQEQLRKTTIQTTMQHVAHLLVVDVDCCCCLYLKSGPATFLIPRTTSQPAVTRNQTATMTTTK